MDSINQRVSDFKLSYSCSDMYVLLATSLRPPSKEFVQGLLDGSIVDDINNIICELGLYKDAGKDFQDALWAISETADELEYLYTKLRREYTRLFTNPEAPVMQIHEAMFLFDSTAGIQLPLLFVSSNAKDADRCYKQIGLTTAKDVNESPDHLATELEFMAFLYKSYADAQIVGDSQKEKQVSGSINEFNQLHVSKWMPAFFTQLSEVSNNSIYQSIGKLGFLFVNSTLQ